MTKQTTIVIRDVQSRDNEISEVKITRVDCNFDRDQRQCNHNGNCIVFKCIGHRVHRSSIDHQLYHVDKLVLNSIQHHLYNAQ